jgi:hypothetical protein
LEDFLLLAVDLAMGVNLALQPGQLQLQLGDVEPLQEFESQKVKLFLFIN